MTARRCILNPLALLIGYLVLRPSWPAEEIVKYVRAWLAAVCLVALPILGATILVHLFIGLGDAGDLVGWQSAAFVAFVSVVSAAKLLFLGYQWRGLWGTIRTQF